MASVANVMPDVVRKYTPATMITDQLRRASDEEIKEALAGAHPPTLRGLLYFLTGDQGLEAVKVTAGPGFLTAKGALIEDPDDLGLLQRKGVELLAAYRDGKAFPPDPTTVTKEHLLHSISLMVGMEVPESEYEYWREECAFDPWARALEWNDKPKDKVADFKVAVIGAGLNGLNAAIQLKRAGFSLKVFERNAGVGGTWYENNYPGARVDLASRIYSHLFGVNYPWEHLFATSQENSEYANWCVDNFDIRSDIDFNTTVDAMTWDDAAGEWEIRVARKDGTKDSYRANAVISAGGLFDRPFYGDFKGKEDFKGVMMHTARYNKSVDMSDMRIGVIGTGASAVQMVPDLAPTVKSLTVFQRTAPWVLPLPGYRETLPDSMRWLNANLPFYVNFQRVSVHWLAGDHDQWAVFTIDPNWKDEHTLNEDMFVFRQRCVDHIKSRLEGRQDLIDKSLPNYPPLTKRFVLDNGWYDALMRNNVSLVTEPIDRIVENGIRTQDGEVHEFDAIIFGTGYQPNAFLEPMKIRGRNGITPAEIWKKDGARAFWGTNVPGLPNFFMLYGPNTNGKISGPVPWGEMTTRYALQCFKALIEQGKKSVEVRKDVYENFNSELDEWLKASIWLDPRQQSYYTNEHGRSATNAPWYVSQLWNAWRRPNLDNYVVR